MGETNFDKIKLKKKYCECGETLFAYHIISGEAIIEVKCKKNNKWCKKFNTFYLKKESS